mmetsp:Transcript_23672/g.32504  ORF Transcript_23672/g.32504 Transcript_23672/m.32504 type:complete len:91 (-) Transcript_23672:56-328(-)
MPGNIVSSFTNSEKVNFIVSGRTSFNARVKAPYIGIRGLQINQIKTKHSQLISWGEFFKVSSKAIIMQRSIKLHAQRLTYYMFSLCIKMK